MMAAVCATSLAFFAEVELQEDILRLGDIVNLSVLPSGLAERARGTALLRVARDIPQTAVRRRELAAQAGARLPILVDCFEQLDGDPVVIRRKVAEAAPRVKGADASGVTKGERVAVRIATGPFTIERGGFAVGDAKLGDRLFVRTGNGQVVRAIVEGERP